MNALWYKEWREFSASRRTLLLRLLLPALLLAPLLQVPALQMPALAGALFWLGAHGTAAQIARERLSGYLPRLALTPVPPAQLILHRVLCRTVLLALQMGAVLALAAWYGALSARLMLLVPAMPAAVAAGALIGLRAPSRRGAQLAGMLVALASAVAGWGTGQQASPPPGASALALMSAAGPGLPLHLTVWVLMAGLLIAAIYAAPAILGAPEEQQH